VSAEILFCLPTAPVKCAAPAGWLAEEPVAAAVKILAGIERLDPHEGVKVAAGIAVSPGMGVEVGNGAGLGVGVGRTGNGLPGGKLSP
jgi:hypothetical protein